MREAAKLFSVFLDSAQVTYPQSLATGHTFGLSMSYFTPCCSGTATTRDMWPHQLGGAGPPARYGFREREDASLAASSATSSVMAIRKPRSPLTSAALCCF